MTTDDRAGGPPARVLVAGGAGEVGEGLLRSLLRAGAAVVVPSRTRERLDQLRAVLMADGTLAADAADRLELIELDVSSEAGVARLVTHLRKGVPLHAAVASLGGWWQGAPLTAVSLSLWHALLDASLTAHFLLARAVLPLLADRPGASYTLINGAGGLQAVPGAGPISVSAAAQLMLKDVLAVEHRDRPVRINSLVLATPVRTRS
nr:SDR family oxidoreductase [Gemmatimonadaceae bacterium]